MDVYVDPEHDQFAGMTTEELRAQVLAEFAALFPELRRLGTKRQALIVGAEER